jgi:hypothetical protein
METGLTRSLWHAGKRLVSEPRAGGPGIEDQRSGGKSRLIKAGFALASIQS